MQFWLKGLSLSLNLCGGVQCWPRHLWTGPTLQGHLSGNKKQQPPIKTTHKLIQASENNCVQKQNYLFSLFHQEIDFVLTSVTLRLQRSLHLFSAAVTRYAKGSCGTFKYLWLCLENVVVVKRGEVCICSIKTRDSWDSHDHMQTKLLLRIYCTTDVSTFPAAAVNEAKLDKPVRNPWKDKTHTDLFLSKCAESVCTLWV